MSEPPASSGRVTLTFTRPLEAGGSDLLFTINVRYVVGIHHLQGKFTILLNESFGD